MQNKRRSIKASIFADYDLNGNGELETGERLGTAQPSHSVGLFGLFVCVFVARRWVLGCLDAWVGGPVGGWVGGRARVWVCGVFVCVCVCVCLYV